MDAVELSFPVDVAAPKLIGSEGLVRTGVSVKKSESEFSSVTQNPSIERCSSYISKKDTKTHVNASASVSWDKIPDAEHFRDARQLPSFQCEASENHESGSINFLLFTSRPEGGQSQRKAGKVSRNSSFYPKRPLTAQVEDSIALAGLGDVKNLGDMLGSYPKKCTSPDKRPLVKQRNNFNSKRGDKKAAKVSLKTKYDSSCLKVAAKVSLKTKYDLYSLKAASGSFRAASAGGNFYGVYGLKSDAQDMAKLIDDLPLNELLDGTYECRTLAKDKAKREANTNDNLLNCVRKAFSVLQLSGPVPSQNVTETDSCSIKMMSTSPLNSVSVVASGINCDQEEACTTDLYSCKKIHESSSKSEIPPNPPSFLISNPEDIFQRLLLTPPKDLDTLLQDATKHPASLKNQPDQRPGKQLSRGASLPPFQWSHTLNGHSRTNDATKLSASRSTCPVRWSRIRNDASYLGIGTDCFTKLESLTFDHSIVPSGLKTIRLDSKISSSVSFNHPQSDRISLSSATYLKASSVTLETEGKAQLQGNDVHSPTVVAAAQILCDMASHSLRHNPDGIIRWPKKPSHKAMKARKLKSNEKPEDVFGTPVSSLGSDNLMRNTNRTIPSKKPKLATIENKKDLVKTHSQKGTITWSAPRSNRSPLPSKFTRDSISVNQSCVMPPPPTMMPLGKACEGQQNGRKSTHFGKARSIRNGFESEGVSL